MPEPRRCVGRYEIVREIGRGGMAAVYLAHQGDLGREVALKQLAGLHASDPESVARFLHESQVTGRLSHPNIVTVHEFFEHEGIPYIAMEYLTRGSLRPHVGRLGLAGIAGVLEDVLAALAHAAESGVVHRDLKPENLMVTAAGGVKVADFGIAKAIGQVATGFQTATGAPIGTPAYMAPEQAMARPVGPATDLYATGVIAHELLLGRVPFENAEVPMMVLLKHELEPLTPPRELDPTLDPELAAWLERMLAKRPEDRPADAAAAWEALEEIVIRLLGPRWRRDARIRAEGDEDARAPTPTPPRAGTPAPATVTPEPRATPEPVVTPEPRATPQPTVAPEPRAPGSGETLASPPPPPSGTPPAAAPGAPGKRSRRRGARIAVVAAIALVAAGGVGLAVLLPGEEAPSAAPPVAADPQPDPEPAVLTLAEYRREANAICSELPDVGELFSTVETPEQLRQVVVLALSSAVRPGIERFDALAPPPQAEAGHREILASAREEERVLERLAADLERGTGAQDAAQRAATDLDALAVDANARSRALGLTECVEADPAPAS